MNPIQIPEAFANGESWSIQMSGEPVVTRLVITTPGGTVISVPVAGLGEVTITAGRDMQRVGFALDLTESTVRGLRLVKSESDVTNG